MGKGMGMGVGGRGVVQVGEGRPDQRSPEAAAFPGCGAPGQPARRLQRGPDGVELALGKLELEQVLEHHLVGG